MEGVPHTDEAAELDWLSPQRLVDGQHLEAVQHTEIGCLTAGGRQSDQMGMTHRVECARGESRPSKGDELQAEHVASCSRILLHEALGLKSGEQARDTA